MHRLELKATHKPVQNYYAALRQFDDLGVSRETAVRSAFQSLLDYCARQHDWTLVPEWERAVSEYQDPVPELAHSLIAIIEKERKTNRRFIKAFVDFAELARRSANPNPADAAAEEMLI